MAKARRKKRQLKTIAEKKALPKEFPKSASFIPNVVSVLLVIFGLLAIFFGKLAIKIFEEYLGKTTLNELTLIIYGILWIFFAVALYILNQRIQKTRSFHWMGIMLLLGIVIAYFRPFCGAAVIIASVIYMKYR